MMGGLGKWLGRPGPDPAAGRRCHNGEAGSPGLPGDLHHEKRLIYGLTGGEMVNARPDGSREVDCQT